MMHLRFMTGMLAMAALAQQGPWNQSELLEADALAARLSQRSASHPIVLYVGFPMLYRSSHIPGAALAGPASKPSGLEALKAAVSNVPHDAEIVIYCGCCPFDQCPNIRPAYAELRKAGFTNVKVLSLPTNFSKDWIGKGYPVERPRASAQAR
jgi:rhodanese-related sulfurtransferase